MEMQIRDWIEKVTNSSNNFETTNTDLKRRYLIRNIQAFNRIVSTIDVCRGSFGTGYPFYVLQRDLKGQLPIIPEQIRYNNELLEHVNRSKRTIWSCRGCLSKNYDKMPDLKQVCKPCPNMDSELKPRKLINRLPDLDMWFVCQDGHVEEAQEELAKLLDRYDIRTSDIDPVQTIIDLEDISESIKKGIMPKKFLPIDAHIIEYSKIKELITHVPSILHQALEEGKSPYIPIHPKSYRKTWQYDDEPYNFIYDFLSAFTEFNFDAELSQVLRDSRTSVVKSYSPVQLYRFVLQSATAPNKRRYKTPELVRTFLGRIQSWNAENQIESKIQEDEER